MTIEKIHTNPIIVTTTEIISKINEIIEKLNKLELDYNLGREDDSESHFSDT